MVLSVAPAGLGFLPGAALGAPAEQPNGGPWTFTNASVASGLDYTHTYDPSVFTGERYHIAGGLAIGDLNNDGWDDLYAVTGHNFSNGVNLNPNRLFVAVGDGSYTEAAAAWGLNSHDTHSAGPLIADFNGDGYNDLLLGGVEGNLLDGGVQAVSIRLYLNTGGSGFADFTVGSKLAGLVGATMNFGMAAADIDGDGDLDLFITHWQSSNRKFLFRNDGLAIFTDISTTHLSNTNITDLFTPAFVDVNGDGQLDLLIAGDFLNETAMGGGSRYFLNSGNGFFIDQGHPVPIPPGPNPDPLDGPDQNGMGSAIADYDNDGDLDWFVSSIHDPDGVSEANWGVTGNRLYRNDGAGHFTDVTGAAGVRAGFWGWGSCFADFNNDMHLDLFHVNGFRSALNGKTEFENDPARMFISNGDGTFTEQSVALGLADTPYGRAVVCFDNDRDGDIDILVNNNRNTSRFFRNELANGNHFITIKLKQDIPNASAIGATIALTAGGITQLRVVQAGGNFSSSHPTAQHFGLGSNTKVDSITITWPDGQQESHANLAVDRYVQFARGSDTLFKDGFE